MFVVYCWRVLVVVAWGLLSWALLVFPNRYSVYRDYVASDRGEGGVLALEALIERGGMYDILADFRGAVEAGTVDLYYPNDTHTSAVGYELAAAGLIKWLLDNGLLVADE